MILVLLLGLLFTLSSYAQEQENPECVGGTDQMTVVVTGGLGAITYQSQSSPNGTSDWANATRSTINTNSYLPDNSIPGTTHYRILVNASDNGCDQVISNTIAAIIAEYVSITTHPHNVVECVGGTTIITVTVVGGSCTLSYQWQQSPPGTSGWTNAIGTGPTTHINTPLKTHLAKCSAG